MDIRTKKQARDSGTEYQGNGKELPEDIREFLREAPQFKILFEPAGERESDLTDYQRKFLQEYSDRIAAALAEDDDIVQKDPAEHPSASKQCPECNHTFQGKGWEGIDAHWRAKHEEIMPYEEAWPLIRDGTYRPGS